MVGKRRAEPERGDEERERSPSASVEHAVIRDKLGQGRGRQEVTGQEKRRGIQRRKCKSMLDGSHTQRQIFKKLSVWE